jgi:tripartite-type tricarboxylate transporter receptor subunit TctC
MRALTRVLIAVAPLLVADMPFAKADNYPSRPIKIIVPFPSGGATDVVTRSIGERVAANLGQPWVIENRPGANGAIGLGACAAAASDGYTFCLLTADQLTIMPHYNSELFSRYSSLVPMTMLVRAPGIIYAGKDVKAQDIKQFVELARSDPGSLNYASFGVGSPPQIFFEWLNKTQNLSIQHIPFKGSNDALAEIMSGRVQATYVALGFVVEHLKAGTLKGLAVLGDQRAPLIPTVPTLTELGFDYPLKGTWFALGAPKDTPSAILEKVSSAIRTVLHEAEFKKLVLDPVGYIPVGSSPAEFADAVKTESARGKEIISVTGLRAQP